MEATFTAIGTLGGFAVGGGGGALLAVATGGANLPAVPAEAYAGAAAGAGVGLAAGQAVTNVLFSQNSGSSAGSDDQASAQDRRLTPGEVRRLEEGGVDAHGLKPGRHPSRYDLFKDREGNILVKPKSGRGPGDPTGYNINDF